MLTVGSIRSHERKIDPDADDTVEDLLVEFMDEQGMSATMTRMILMTGVSRNPEAELPD